MMSEAVLLDPLVKLISTILVDLKPLFLFFGTPKLGIFGGLNYIVKWSVVKHFQRSWLRLCESEKSWFYKENNRWSPLYWFVPHVVIKKLVKSTVDKKAIKKWRYKMDYILYYRITTLIKNSPRLMLVPSNNFKTMEKVAAKNPLILHA